MQWLYQFVFCLMILGLLIACLYMVMQVRKVIVQFQTFEDIFRDLHEANTRVRFGVTGLKDKVAFIETLLDDLQTQVDILLHSGKTEVNDGNNNNSHDSANSSSNS